MFKNYKIFFLLLLVIISCYSFLSSCRKKETVNACFTYTVGSINTGSVTFDITCSDKAELYTWDFGDGTVIDTSMTNFAISHQYAELGEYKVSMSLGWLCGVGLRHSEDSKFTMEKTIKVE